MRSVSQSPAPQSYYKHRNVGQDLPGFDTAHVLKLSGVNDTSTLVRRAVVSSCGLFVAVNEKYSTLVRGTSGKEWNAWD